MTKSAAMPRADAAGVKTARRASKAAAVKTTDTSSEAAASVKTATTGKATAAMETAAPAKATASVATPAAASSTAAAARIGNIKWHGHRDHKGQSDQPNTHEEYSVQRLMRIICRISVLISG
jgi:hypothetical protein